MKTLVLVFHPDMSASRANRLLAAKAETLGNDVTVRYMYDLYPDQKVDVAAEQAALEAADRVVLQFPMYWYSTPALLKQWQDDVLLYGWAYGSTGKELLVAVSTGGPGDAYSHESSYGYTLTELLRPLQATANMVQMTYLEPFTTTGTLTITDEALAKRAEDYAATLQSTDLPVLEPRG
ncbi:NAD(P)H-dependent oxidoreductase [Actinomyces oris]|uniref:NAD(P)H oxidoreductase n=1 Tax=Actinomyces oris TaxID=544580 RepID=A0A1Q8I2Q4_9ACTO|nr:NAD(P)H-dependent oxidoreductase [Actinomyces oris]OLL15360.1 NAD(P)H oxidoreductase [Actinomyces oris]